MKESINLNIYNSVFEFIKTDEYSKDYFIPALNVEACNQFNYQTNSTELGELYNVRYLGELLERYQQKEHQDILIIRAIALSFANHNYLTTEEMFTGQQKENYLKELAAIIGKEFDIYIAISLIILKPDLTKEITPQILNYRYTNTIDFIFLLNYLDGIIEKDSISMAINKLEPYFDLLTVKKTIDSYNDFTYFASVIPFCKRYKKDKRINKGIRSILSNFYKLSIMHPKAESNLQKSFELLGFEYLEILYLAHEMQPYITNYEKNQLGNSPMKMQKLAANILLICFNNLDYNERLLKNFVEYLFIKYKNFNRKIDGCDNILDYIIPQLKVKNKNIFLWLFEYFVKNNKHISYNLLCHDKDIMIFIKHIYDNVPKLKKQIFNFFFNYIRYCNQDKLPELVEEMSSIINANFIEELFICDYNTPWPLFIEAKLVSLEKLYDTYENEVNDYVSYFKSELCYNFLINHSKKFPIKDYPDKYERLLPIGKSYQYRTNYSFKTTNFLDILNDNAINNLVSLIDEYLYYHKQDWYADFLLYIMKNEKIRNSFGPKGLYDVYRYFVANQTNLSLSKNDINNLDSIFLTPEEYTNKTERNRERESIEREEMIKTREMNCFSEICSYYNDLNDQVYSNLLKVYIKYSKQSDYREIVINFIMNSLKVNSSRNINEENTDDFITFIYALYNDDIISAKDLIKYITKINIKGESA